MKPKMVLKFKTNTQIIALNSRKGLNAKDGT